MTVRPFLIPIVCAISALAACDGSNSVRIASTATDDGGPDGVLKVVETLQCPQTMGSLTRKGSASAAGTVCTYVGPKGAEASLHLVPLDGDTPANILEAFEQRLSGEMPRAVRQLEAPEAVARSEANSGPTADSATETPAAPADRASVRAPGVAVEAQGDEATVSLPGVRIETRGDKASVRIGGFHIDADDSSGTARISGPGGDGENVSINARNDAAEIRTSAGGGATRSSWILTDNRPSERGWRLVGYEARGPVGGPLVVATVRSRDTDRGRAFEDAKDLVALNVGE
jgi:hypothetical protein